MKVTNTFYNSNLKEYARELRTESVSRAEKYLWKVISRKQLGVGFKRQRPIAHFIVDFCATEIMLIIEIDGNSHTNKGDYDKRRQTILTDLGFTIIRFSEGEVLQDIDAVIVQIQHVIYCLKEQKNK